MSPKKRLKENRALPARWKWSHGSIYYLVPPNDKHLWDNKSWFRLGKTLAEAHRTFSERVHESGAKVVTVQHLFDRFEFEYLPTKSKATQKYYLHALPILRQVFTTNKIHVAALEPHHAYKMMEFVTKEYNTKRAAQCMECLSSAYSQAVRWGEIKANPFIGQVKKPSSESGGREVKDAELIGFAATIPRKWQLYISLKLHTKGRRKGELLRLMRSSLTEEGIVFVNNKRKSDRFIVPWTPTLKAVVEEIIKLHPSRVGDTPLFFGRGYKPYINEDGETSGFNSIWQRYMRKWVALGNERFREHDLRAKAVEGESLEVAARLLRHTSQAVTQKHYRPGLEQI
jgi:integrase